MAKDAQNLKGKKKTEIYSVSFSHRVKRLHASHAFTDKLRLAISTLLGYRSGGSVGMVQPCGWGSDR
ncbi:MAG: hypothetical protein EA367_07715 [Leptolyngbya sp. DLM2.Bin15]|nr:MAG: hypothetical protein EA367_07715 [Leptolyngbya sp. DLM2.Bin15]